VDVLAVADAWVDGATGRAAAVFRDNRKCPITVSARVDSAVHELTAVPR
jgi:hypothetical protein